MIKSNIGHSYFNPLKDLGQSFKKIPKSPHLTSEGKKIQSGISTTGKILSGSGVIGGSGKEGITLTDLKNTGKLEVEILAGQAIQAVIPALGFEGISVGDMIKGIFGIGTAIAGQKAAEQDYQEMQEALKLYEKETKRIQEDIRQQTKLSLQQLDLQRKQQVAAFNQSVFERKLQGLKAISGSQVALAARGLQGGTAGRLLETIQYDTSKDIGIIQENLRNYLAQQTLREEQYRAAGEAQINQYEAQLEMQRQRVKAQEPSFWSTTWPIVTQTAGLFL